MPAAGKTHPNAGALFCRNAPALCVRAHLKLYILVHADRDAERRQPVIGTVCPGDKINSCASDSFEVKVSFDHQVVRKREESNVKYDLNLCRLHISVVAEMNGDTPDVV